MNTKPTPPLSPLGSPSCSASSVHFSSASDDHKQIGANPEQAERIRELEEQIKVKGFLLNEAMKEIETEQAANRELYAMLGHIVDWSPELPYYMKDEYKTLFRNALAAARELLSKCKVKEGK